MEPPLKRQKGLARACEACKARKAKCDSGRPRCDVCNKKGTDCMYREKGQPGLRPGYGKGVEQRLTNLEESTKSMHSIIRELQSANQELKLAHTINNTSMTITSMASPRSGPHPSSDITGGHLNKSWDALSRSSNIANNHQDEPWITEHHPPNSHTDMPEPIEITDYDQGQPWSEEQTLSNAAKDLSQTISNHNGSPQQHQTLLNGNPNEMLQTGQSFDYNNEIPPEFIIRELLELFFEHVYPTARIFYKPKFTANIFLAENVLLLHAIVVVAFRYWAKPEPEPAVRERYVQISKDKILLSCADQCSITSTQALTLLILDAMGDVPGPRAWNFIALVTAAVQKIGLDKSNGDDFHEANVTMVHNESQNDILLSSTIEVEERRRLFWTIYTLDRFASLAHGTMCRIDGMAIKQTFPVNEQDWDRPISTEWFQAVALPRDPSGITHNLWRCHIEVIALLDRTHQFLLQPVNLSSSIHFQEWQNKFYLLDLALSTWMQNLPEKIREPPDEFDPMWIMVHATFHMVIIRMHSIAAFPSTTSPHFRASPSAPGRCRQAVRSITSLCKSLKPQELDQMGPLFAFIVWVASRNLIILWTAGYEHTYGVHPPDLMILLGALRRISTHWPVAQSYADIIQFILDTKNKPTGASGLSVFNDTRRTVYGIQSLLGGLAAENNLWKLDPLLDWLDLSLLDENSTEADGPGGEEMNSVQS